jgi:U1 small nuclear ribonucleoprotein C
MPRFFDDYSNTYLTHDSAAGRKQQRRGWKFRENFKLHYESFIEEWRRGEMGLAAAQQGYIRARGKDDPMISPLPDGWKEDTDECTGITYYYNDETGKRTWARPGFIPPLPGPPGRPPPMMQGGGPPPPAGRGGYHPRPGGPPPRPPYYGGGPPGQVSAQQPPPHFPPGGPLPPPPPPPGGFQRPPGY